MDHAPEGIFPRSRSEGPSIFLAASRPPRFPKTLQTLKSLMGSSSTAEQCSQQKALDVNGELADHPHSAGTSRAPSRPPISVLSSLPPPGLWEELSGCVTLPRKGRMLPRPWSLVLGLFPILRWGRRYNWRTFRSDLMAGLTLGSLSIPQGIGYASLAKMDPQYGLYSSVVPPLIYAVMGSSKEIAIGPVAVVSLLLSSMVQKLVDPATDPDAYRRLVFTATFFAGLFQAAFGLFRLGFLVDFLSHAALVGFMGGAAMIIGLQQLKGLLGISHFTNKTDVISVVKAVWVAVHEPWHPANFLLGTSFLMFILASRFVGRRKRGLYWLPAVSPLVSVIVSTLLVLAIGADKHDVKIIRHVQGGINPSSIKQLELDGPSVAHAAKIGMITAVIALTEAIAVGRSFASVRGYHIDGNKEMLALGCMNLAGSVSSCYVATGSFSRTAVNFTAGCKTAISNVVMAVTVLISLKFLTGLLYYTPTAILASIILSALPGLIDFREAHKIWKVDKLDFTACLGAFLGVLFVSVEIGLLAAVAISFVKIILHSLRPRIEALGRIQGTDIFCSIRQFPSMVVQTPKLLAIRIESAYLSFLNGNYVRERILSWVVDDRKMTEENPEDRIRALVIDMSNVMNIDMSGILTLQKIHKQLSSQGLQVAIANPSLRVTHKIRLAKLYDRFGDWFFLTVGDAVEACLEHSKNVVINPTTSG